MLLKKILKWTGIILLGLYGIVVIGRAIYFYRVDKTNEQVAKIHSTRLQLSDVMGSNLPSDPGEAADDTVAGIDANKNGIRDDVELAIFKEYPNSAKTRAALLQYALALQIEFTQPIINSVTVTETIREQSRADACVSDTTVPRKTPESSRTYADVEKIQTFIDFIEDLHINTSGRERYHESFYNQIDSYSDLRNSACDINLSTLPN